jgi:energy-coupling factor transporter ATP-binding protein EcfA2
MIQYKTNLRQLDSEIGTVTTKKMIKSLKKNKDVEMYEVLNTNVNLKLYFDIELYEYSDKSSRKTIKSLLKKLDEQLLKNNLNIDNRAVCSGSRLIEKGVKNKKYVDESDLDLSQLSSLIDNNEKYLKKPIYKNSYHIHYPNIIFNNQSEILYFVNEMLIPNIKMKHYNRFFQDKKCTKYIDHCLDMSVYNKSNNTQLFRFVNCTKSNQKESKFIPSKKLSKSTDIKHFLISTNEQANTNHVISKLTMKNTPRVLPEKVNKDAQIEKKETKEKKYKAMPYEELKIRVDSLKEDMYDSELHYKAICREINNQRTDKSNKQKYIDLALSFAEKSSKFDAQSKRKIISIFNKQPNKSRNAGHLIKNSVYTLAPYFNRDDAEEVNNHKELFSKYNGKFLEYCDIRDHLKKDMKKIYLTNEQEKIYKVKNYKGYSDMNLTSFVNMLKRVKIYTKKDPKKPITLYAIFNNDITITYVDRLIFDADMNYKKKRSGDMNLFTGYSNDRNTNFKYDLKKIPTLLQYFKYLTSNENEANQKYFLSLLGSYLKGKTCSALYIVGRKGCGKSTLSLIMDKLTKNEDVSYVHTYKNIQSFSKSFNGELNNKTMCIIEEAATKNTIMKNDIFEKLKEMITSPKLEIEQKGKTKKMIKNNMNVMIFSNCTDLPITSDSRRFFCLNINKLKNDEFYQALYNEIENEECMKHLFYFLLSQPKLAYRVPKTKFFSRLISQTMNSAEKFILSNVLLFNKVKFVVTEYMYDYYNIFCAKNKFMSYSRQTFISSIKKTFNFENARISLCGKKTRVIKTLILEKNEDILNTFEPINEKEFFQNMPTDSYEKKYQMDNI